MPINERQAEQPAPPPHLSGLAWPSSGDAPSRAEQPPQDGASETSRAGQSTVIRNRRDVPDGYLDVTGGWTPDQAIPLTLMDLCADGRIPEPSATALDRVVWTTDQKGPAATYQLLLATAITLLEQESVARNTVRRAASIAQLVEAGRDGVLALKGAADRAGEARPFA